MSAHLTDAADHGLTSEAVINTRFHAGFLAGHLEPADYAGAWIGYGQRAEAEHPVRRLTDGERISLGDVRLPILETPGHTPQLFGVLVREHADDTVPHGVLAGDALFIGDVGRRNLLASVGVTADELGRMLRDTVRNRLTAPPGAVRALPAHGAGSACGKNLSAQRRPMLGEQRATHDACRSRGEERSVEPVTAGQPSAPACFACAAVLNRKEHGLFGAADAPRALSTAEFLERRTAGAVVSDAPSPQGFAAGHLRGSLDVPADGRFAEQAGMVVAPEQDVVVIAPRDREEEIVIRLARIGFDKGGGCLRGPEGAFADLAAEVRRAGRLASDELRRALDGDQPPPVLDVRDSAEREGGFIEGPSHIPRAELTRRAGEIPVDRPLGAHCAGGHRSSPAAGLPRHVGRADVSDLLGGYGARPARPAPAESDPAPPGGGPGTAAAARLARRTLPRQQGTPT